MKYIKEILKKSTQDKRTKFQMVLPKFALVFFEKYVFFEKMLEKRFWLM